MKHPSEWEGPRGKDAAAPLNALSLRLARAVLGALAWIVFMETVGRLVRRYCHFPVPACAARFLDSPWRSSGRDQAPSLSRLQGEPCPAAAWWPWMCSLGCWTTSGARPDASKSRPWRLTRPMPTTCPCLTRV